MLLATVVKCDVPNCQNVAAVAAQVGAAAALGWVFESGKPGALHICPEHASKTTPEEIRAVRKNEADYFDHMPASAPVVSPNAWKQVKE